MIEEYEFSEINGENVSLFTLKNKHMAVTICNYRGIITQWQVRDMQQQWQNIVLGYDNLAAYQADPQYLGAIIGRYANRIANAKFCLHGKTYPLAKNNGNNNLHSGDDGLNQAIWSASTRIDNGIPSLILTYASCDGEQGFPGNLSCSVIYRLEADKLSIDYRASCDQDTPVNFTNHSYFNLAGVGNGDILEQQLAINADYFTPTNNDQIPTGEIVSVVNTPFDFRQLTPIGDRIDADDQQLVIGQGYDHNFVLRQGEDWAAKAYCPMTGISLTISTSQPGLQFYSGNGLSIGHQRRSGFALETQHFPDTPNQPQFPSTLLRAGEMYQQQTSYCINQERKNAK